eukprot:6723698-Pyramimonas_sp.AAC.1
MSMKVCALIGVLDLRIRFLCRVGSPCTLPKKALEFHVLSAMCFFICQGDSSRMSALLPEGGGGTELLFDRSPRQRVNEGARGGESAV